MKQFRLLLASIAVLLGCATAHAHDFEVDGIYYKILSSSDLTVEVTFKGDYSSSYSNEYSGNVGVPESVTFDGQTYSVTNIGKSAFYSCGNLTSITIPNSVASINNDAFRNCTHLASVNLGNSVTSIGEYAFYNCSDLYSLTIPNSVKNIGEWAFGSCLGLKFIIIPDGVPSIEKYTFGWCSNLVSITIPNSVTSIGESAFYGCSSLTSVTIPNSVTNIGIYAFYGCSGLRSATVGNNVTSIGDCAFQGCSGLTSIAIPNSVTSVGLYAFSNCSGLTSVTVGDNVTNIGGYAFDACSQLTSVTIPGSITSIGEYAFNCNNLISVTVESDIPINLASGNIFSNRANATLNVPPGCKSEYEAAEYWKDFKEIVEYAVDENITFADAKVKELCVANWDTNGDGELSKAEAAKVTDLGEVFKSNSTIKSFDELSYFTGLTSIGERAFYNCDGLTSVTIPNSVTSIGSYAFFYCSGLTSIEIPNSVTSIGSSAFYGCSGLTSIVIPNSVTSIGSYAFFYCSGLTSIAIPNSVTSIGECAFSSCEKLTSIIVDSENEVYDSRNNCNAIIETASNKLIAGCKTTVIPNSVTSIGSSAFRYCKGLTSIEIPNSVTSIGSEAFYNCDVLTSIEIPNSVTSIGRSAFSSCEKLTSIIVDSENKVYDSRNNCNAIIETASNKLIAGCKTTVIPNSVTSIGSYAFYGCKGLTSITIPNSVTSIGSGAFAGCSGLTSIEIPNSVTSIGSGAFAGCSGLTSIAIPNSVTSIGESAFFYCTGLTSIVIPNSVTSIGYGAFSSCSKLTSVTVGNSTPVAITSDYTFQNRANATLYVPAGSKAAYEAADYWKEFKEIVELSPTSVTITINQYGSSTYCSEYALDFTNVEGLKAYVATGYNTRTGVVTMTRVMTAKGGTGLFLKGEQGSYEVPVIAESDDNTLNLLVGTLAKVTVNSKDDIYTNYKFTVKAGETEPGFYNFEDNSTLSANKAYLHIPTAWLPSTSEAKSVRMWFEDEEATGIDEINTNRPDSDTIYDMQGRRVKNPSKGMYIVNGKKMLIK